MQRLLIPALLIVALLIAACQPADDTVPTLIEVPTETPTEDVTETPEPTETPTDTATPVPTDTPTLRPSPTRRPTQTLTFTPSPTNTEAPTDIPVVTEDPTDVVASTATAAQLEAPAFSTFTPVPPGVTEAARRPTSTGTPLVAADLFITEPQFQEEINRLIADKASIQQAIVTFTSGRVNVEMTAVVDGITLRGTMYLSFSMFNNSNVNNVLRIEPAPPTEIVLTGGAEAPSGFVEVAYTDMAPVVLEAFAFIIDQRLGVGQHDLEFLTIDDDSIDVFLVVPQPAGN